MREAASYGITEFDERKNEKNLATSVSQALGASRVVAVPDLPRSGPLDLFTTAGPCSAPRTRTGREAGWRHPVKLAGQLSDSLYLVRPTPAVTGRGSTASPARWSALFGGR